MKEYIGNVRVSSPVAPDISPTSSEWMDGALCTQVDPDTFHPEKGVTSAAAKRICRACDVQFRCLEYALDNNLRYGIYGGLSETERRGLRVAPLPKDAA